MTLAAFLPAVGSFAWRVGFPARFFLFPTVKQIFFKKIKKKNLKKEKSTLYYSRFTKKREIQLSQTTRNLKKEKEDNDE